MNPTTAPTPDERHVPSPGCAPSSSSGPRLTPRTLERLCRIARERAGIELTQGKEQLLALRVGRRLRALRLSSPEQYLRILERDDAGEVVHFLDAISTNVTAFFREPAHFDALAAALRQWETRGNQRLFRLWSAAASSGEEAYSLAITCCETLRPSSEFRILATDLSTAMLQRAEQGRYTARALRNVPGPFRARYFLPARDHDNCFEVCEDIRRHVIFERVNLAEPPLPINAPVDCTLCRNVLMYLSAAVRQTLLREIERILRPGGLLMIGHAETLIGLDTSLRLVHPSVYQKETSCKSAAT